MPVRRWRSGDLRGHPAPHVPDREDLDETYNTSLKVNPPLRTDEDAEAIRQGVIDGTVDVIVTDHAPHTPWEKAREFELAPFGMIGLETSLSLVLTELVNTGKMSMGRMVELMAHQAA